MPHPSINWDISQEDFKLIVEIAERAMRDLTRYPDDKRTLIMDLNACHANGCPLDLKGLLAADGYEFSHDIVGIREAINRDTGKLTEDCFMPRYALANRAPIVSALPGGVVVSGGTKEQHDILHRRSEFVAQYCEQKGWQADNLTLEEVLEIRSQPDWQTPGKKP